MPEASHRPFVSVVMAARNEAPFIEEAVRHVLENGYPADRMEVLVVDGMSDDGTADIVRGMAAADPRVRLVENPKRVTPVAFNLGIGASRGDIVFILGAHGNVVPDYFGRLVRILEERPEVWCTGGATHSIGVGYLGTVVSAAQSSPIGAGNARFRLGSYKGYVDTVSFCGYRREVFDKIGLFDEELVRNQDDDLNYRLIQAGGKIYMDSAIYYDYRVRGSLGKLALQYFQYGKWRIRTIQKHGRPASIRQIAPLAFVCVWLALIAAAPFSWVVDEVLGAFAALYGLGLLAGAVDVASRAGLRYALLAPLVFAILHFSYGIGGLSGVWHFILFGGKRMEKAEDHPLSR